MSDSGREPPLPFPVMVEPPSYRWYHKTRAVAFAAISMAVGLFLLVFPWTDWWDESYFATLGPWWRQNWENLYVRGAISGLGVVNLFIAVMELFRLRRFARK
jgi:hypothetical protein